MPINPELKNHGEANNEMSKFGLKFRLAVTFILGMVVGGIAVDRCSGDDADQPKKPGIADTGGARGGDGGPDDDDEPLPPNLVPSDEFDKDPLEYVDIEKCRALLFRWTGEIITDDEILERAHQIETERRIFIAENIINRFCISNPQDQDAIRNAVLKGCTKFESLKQWRGGDWGMTLESPTGDWCDTIDLKEEPVCKPRLSKEEEEDRKKRKEERERVKAMAELIKNNQFNDVLGDIDISLVEDEIKREGLEEGIGGEFVDMLKRVKRQIEDEMDSTQRIILGCELISFLVALDGPLNEEGIDPTIEEAMQTMDNNQVINNAAETFFAFAEALLEASGLDDAEECLLYMHKR